MLDRKSFLSKQSTNPIERCSSHNLQSAYLGNLFRSGTKAVILSDQRIPQIWKTLCGVTGNARTGQGKNFTLDDGLSGLARNYQRDSFLGDKIRFTPGEKGQIIRRLRIYPGLGDLGMEANPAYWVQDSERIHYSQDLLQTVWDLMADILNSTIPIKDIPFPYSVQIELIQYPSSTLELDNIYDLLWNSAGVWTRMGLRLDALREQAHGILRKKGISDLYAFASIIPIIRILTHQLNTILGYDSNKQIPKESRILNRCHVDTDKIITCLASERDVLQTQLYDGASWLNLPLTSNALAIFPGAESQKLTDFTPTRHRVFLNPHGMLNQTDKLNGTLSLSIVKRGQICGKD